MGNHETVTEFSKGTALKNYCNFYNDFEAIKKQTGELTPDRLRNENLRETVRRMIDLGMVARPLGPVEGFRTSEIARDSEAQYQQKADEEIPPGLSDLLADEKTMLLMRVTEEEIAILKGIRFAPGRYQPTKGFYIDVLFDLRKNKEE